MFSGLGVNLAHSQGSEFFKGDMSCTHKRNTMPTQVKHAIILNIKTYLLIEISGSLRQSIIVVLCLWTAL